MNCQANGKAVYHSAISAATSFNISNGRQIGSNDDVICSSQFPLKYAANCNQMAAVSPIMARCLVSSRTPHRIIAVTPAFSSLVDFTEQELLGRSFAILRGPETDTPLLNAAIKAADTNPQSDVTVTLYGRAGDSHQCSASFAVALDRDGCAIGCEISVRPPDNTEAPTAPPPCAFRRCERSASAHAPLRGRRSYNLHVGLLLESESQWSAPTAAARLEEEALLCQLLAEACA